jgi:hypothetical protein
MNGLAKETRSACLLRSRRWRRRGQSPVRDQRALEAGAVVTDRVLQGGDRRARQVVQLSAYLKVRERKPIETVNKIVVGFDRLVGQPKPPMASVGLILMPTRPWSPDRDERVENFQDDPRSVLRGAAIGVFADIQRAVEEFRQEIGGCRMQLHAIEAGLARILRGCP